VKSVTVHAALLVVALGAAAATWTSAKRQFGEKTDIAVWDHDTDDLISLQYRDSTGQVTLERRGTAPDAYLWGTQTYRAVPTDAGLTGLESPAATAPITEDQYPVGEEGETVLEGLAHLRAMRDLGAADDGVREEYGLTDSLPVLEMHFADGTQRSLIFGAPVVGGGLRYALDVEGGHVYAVASDLVSSFEQGAGALRLVRLQSFAMDEVASVTITNAAGDERTLERQQTGNIPPRTVWVPKGGSANDNDVVFAAVVDEISAIFVSGRYLPELKPEELGLLGRADYRDTRGRSLGWTEIYKAKSGGPQYYLRTARTHAIGEMYEQNGTMLERDLATLFRNSAPRS
jgi:hypothetical protein